MSWLSLIASNVLLASLLAAAAWVVQRLLKMHAAARLLWVLALVKLVTPPIAGLPLVELPANAACTLGMCGCPLHHNATPVVAALQTLPTLLLALWATGASWTLAVALQRWVRFRRIVIAARPAPRSWQALAAR